jgi:branched-chain amino acid transport system ATP-binding protein
MSLLELRNLNMSFGGLAVARDISLTLGQGDRVALIGPNGAGKTSLVNLVTGQLKPRSGLVLLEGDDITHTPPAGRARRGLVRSFQVTRLFSEMSGEEHVALAVLQRLGRSGRLFGDYRAMPDVMEETGSILDLLGLSAISMQPVAEIAYGQQRLLEIALAMALRPKVLLLDEPAAGVTRADTALIEGAIAALPADLAVLMVEHDMDLVFRFARRVIVLAAGAVIFDGTAAQAAADRAVREAYLGSHFDARSSA